MKKYYFGALGGLAVIASSCSETNGIKKPYKPNIVIFLADDLGYGDLACYGNPIIKTPNIDRLASQGVMLTDCHSGGTVSSPSRAALLTGKNPYRSGFYYIQGAWGSHLQEEEITIAEMLKTAGYETCFVGKWHLSRLEKNRVDEPGPGDQGFDHWFATTVNAFDGPKDTKKFIRNGVPVGQVDGWYCDVIVKEAVDWLNNIRDKSKPFLLIVSSHEPHTPIEPPEKYMAMYDNDEVNRLESNIKYGGEDRSIRDVSAFKKEYYGTVTQLDNAFGNLLNSIDNTGLKDNTMVIFTSDNGPEAPVTLSESRGEWDDPIRDKCFGTPGDLRGMKRFVYEGGHRVPGIIRMPGYIPAGSVSDKLINGTDFFPILCNLAGVDIPDDRIIDGTDAYPGFLNRNFDRDIQAIWMFPTHEDTYFRMPNLSMRIGNYTLVGSFPDKPDSLNLLKWMKTSVPENFELYDLSVDIEQSIDFSEEKPNILQEMIFEMTRLWLEIRDEGPLFN